MVQKSKSGKNSPKSVVLNTPPSADSSFSKLISNTKLLRKLLIGSLVVLLALGLYYKKSWFVAGTISGKPITSIELITTLNANYRKQALEAIVTNRVIMDEARRRNISIPGSEVDGKIKEYEAQFGGAENFDNLLEQQGQTRKFIVDQVRLQLAMEKMFGAEATVSAEEVDQYVKDNKATLSSDDPLLQKQEAEKTLKQNKLSSLLRVKFEELKEKAKVTIF